MKGRSTPFAKPKRGEVNPFYECNNQPFVGTDNISKEHGMMGVGLVKSALLCQGGPNPLVNRRAAMVLFRTILFLEAQLGLDRESGSCLSFDIHYAMRELHREKQMYARRLKRLNVAHLRERLRRVRFEVHDEMRRLRAVRHTIRQAKRQSRMVHDHVLAESHRDDANRKVYIYALCASDTPDDVAYIGQTYSPHSRLEGHRKSTMHRIEEFFRSVHRRGASVQMRLVEESSRKNADERERYFISLYRTVGMAWLNTSGVYCWNMKGDIGRAA